MESAANRKAKEVMDRDGAGVSRSGGTTRSSFVVGAVGVSTSSAGQRLHPEDRRHFEAGFQDNFSDVRIFADRRAQETARTLDARAYTLGDTISFAAGEYQPGTSEGRHLLAHELTHVLQQRSLPGVPPVIQRQAKGSQQKKAPARKTLKKQGVRVTDPLHAKTAQVIDAVLLSNKRLDPYIGAKLKGGFRIAEKGKFIRELSDGNFENAYRSTHGLSAGTHVSKKTLGFLDHKNSVIHLRPDATFGTAMHEAIHRLAHPSFYTTYYSAAVKVSGDLAEVLLEGLTAHLTDLVLHDEGLGRNVDKYSKLRKKAKKLETALGTKGFELMATLYFQPKGLVDIGVALGISKKRYMALKGKAFSAVLKRMASKI